MAASCGLAQGRAALEAIARYQPTARLRFFPGASPERSNADIPPDALSVFLISVGEAPAGSGAPRAPRLAAPGRGAGALPADVEAAAAPGVCPHLGFADDPTSRYSRPVRLHRCSAKGAGAPVPLETQRDLCLTDGFPRCPLLGQGAEVGSPPRPGPQRAGRQPAAAGAAPGPAGGAGPVGGPGRRGRCARG